MGGRERPRAWPGGGALTRAAAESQGDQGEGDRRFHDGGRLVGEALALVWFRGLVCDVPIECPLIGSRLSPGVGGGRHLQDHIIYLGISLVEKANILFSQPRFCSH